MGIPNINPDLENCDCEGPTPDTRAVSAALNKVVEEVRLLSRADGAAIALRNRGGVFCRACVGMAPAVGSWLPLEPGGARACFETGEAVLCQRSEQDPTLQPSTQDLNPCSTAAVPIMARGAVLGAILVFSSLPSAFGQKDIAALRFVADYLAFIILDPNRAQKPQPLKSNPGLTLVPARNAAKQTEVQQLQTLELKEHRTAQLIAPTETTTGRGWLAFAVVSCLLLVVTFFANLRWNLSKTNSSISQPISSNLEPNGDRHDSGPEKPITNNADSSSPKSTFAKDSNEVIRVYPPSPLSAAAGSGSGKAVRVASGTSSARLITRAPPGAQIFVDNKWKAEIDPSGQAKSLTVSPGSHRLRVALTGYLDYEQEFELRAGQVSTIVAKLEPVEPLRLGSQRRDD